ncbi:MAG: hypothetical protein IJ752_01990 [Alphaproteobacteria bacterium]|nr:hypothetical protein [Alphaproteobacteria bacterium]
MNQYIFPLYGYDKVSKKEALSIPFQQTARYLKKYPEDLSAEERKIIEEVLDISKMTKKYSPFNADFTKSAYKIKNDPNENKKLAAYLKTTVKMFFRHPLTALQATMANSFGYYAFTPYFIIEQKEPFDRQLYTAYPKSTQPLRDFLETFYQDKTVSSLLYTGLRPPVYTWLLVLLGLSFISIKRSKHLLLLVPSAMSVLICIASPINGLLRYMLPVIMSMPIVFSFCLAVYFKEERATENQ